MTTEVEDYEQPEENFWEDATPSFSFDKEVHGGPPLTIRGKVISQQRMQRTDVDTRELATWPDGRPKLKIVIEMACVPAEVKGNPNDEIVDDDGRRLVHVEIPGGKFTAIKQGIKDAGVKTLRNGDELTLTWSSEGKKEKGKSAPKIYDALIVPASPL